MHSINGLVSIASICCGFVAAAYIQVEFELISARLASDFLHLYIRRNDAVLAQFLSVGMCASQVALGARKSLKRSSCFEAVVGRLSRPLSHISQVVCVCMSYPTGAGTRQASEATSLSFHLTSHIHHDQRQRSTEQFHRGLESALVAN